MVEAAMVFPLVILITIGIITAGLNIYMSVRDDAIRHRTDDLNQGAITTENVLRGKWTVSQEKEKTDKDGSEGHNSTEIDE